MMLSSVDLPQPEGPRMATNSSGSTVRRHVLRAPAPPGRADRDTSSRRRSTMTAHRLGPARAGESAGSCRSTVFGRSATNSIQRAAPCSRPAAACTYSRSRDSSASIAARAVLRARQKAWGRMRPSASARPITAASRTAGCSIRAASTSAGDTQMPAHLQHVVGAPAEVEVAVGVLVEHVAGPEPLAEHGGPACARGGSSSRATSSLALDRQVADGARRDGRGPSSSTSRASKPGTTWPLEPGRASPGRLAMKSWSASVEPTTSSSSWPKRASPRVEQRGGSASPDETQSRSEREVESSRGLGHLEHARVQGGHGEEHRRPLARDRSRSTRSGSRRSGTSTEAAPTRAGK